MKHIASSLFPASLILFLFFSSAQSSKVIRVPQKVKSIQLALDNAEAGDTILVSEGVYNESIVMRDDIVLMGMSAERTTIRGNRRKPVVKGAQGAVLKHFTIENGTHGIRCENVVMTIEHCVVRSNKGPGIQAILALPIIRNNVIFRNKGSGIFCESTRSHKGSIHNNVIAENGLNGLMLAGQSEILLENNVFYFNKQYGVHASEGSRRSRVIYNNFFGNRSANNQHVSMDRTNLYQDPAYQLLGAEDFDFWGSETPTMRGKGKEGRDIGLARRTFYIPRERVESVEVVIPVEKKEVITELQQVEKTPEEDISEQVEKPADEVTEEAVQELEPEAADK